MLAVSCMRGPTTKFASPAPLGVYTSPHHPQDSSAINPMALFTQQPRATEMTLPNPHVILNLDEATDNASKDKALSDNSLPSDMLPKRWEEIIPKRGKL